MRYSHVSASGDPPVAPPNMTTMPWTLSYVIACPKRAGGGGPERVACAHRELLVLPSHSQVSCLGLDETRPPKTTMRLNAVYVTSGASSRGPGLPCSISGHVTLLFDPTELPRLSSRSIEPLSPANTMRRVPSTA